MQRRESRITAPSAARASGARHPNTPLIAADHRAGRFDPIKCQLKADGATLAMLRIPRRHIWRDILPHNVDDERFLEIFADFAGLIRTSVKLCDRGAVFPEDEVNYIEELLGLSFLLLQAKIRRVVNAAERFSLTRGDIFNISGDNYKGTKKSIIRLIWEVANYYKHQDDWTREVWEDKKPGEQESKTLKQSRKTRRIIEKKVGIERSSTGMCTAYEFFEIDWASNCMPLAGRVQEWATAVYEKCANCGMTSLQCSEKQSKASFFCRR